MFLIIYAISGVVVISYIFWTQEVLGVVKKETEELFQGNPYKQLCTALFGFMVVFGFIAAVIIWPVAVIDSIVELLKKPEPEPEPEPLTSLDSMLSLIEAKIVVGDNTHDLYFRDQLRVRCVDMRDLYETVMTTDSLSKFRSTFQLYCKY